MADFPNSTIAPEFLRPTNDMTTFMERLLEPLPAAELVDTQYNSLLRRARYEEWRKADTKTRYFRAMLNWRHAQDAYRRWFGGVETIDYAEDVVAALRRAIAEQILVPAPDKASVRWKRAASGDQFLPINPAQVEQAIADDEAWLAAHPAKRTRRA